MDSQDRSFTVEAFYRSGNKLKTHGGRYISTTPSASAKKAFSQYIRNHKNAGNSLVVDLKETTSGSAHKVFKYRVSKVSDKKEVERDGKTIVYKYSIKTRAL